jgi:hypothetical protein
MKKKAHHRSVSAATARERDRVFHRTRLLRVVSSAADFLRTLRVTGAGQAEYQPWALLRLRESVDRATCYLEDERPNESE